MSWAEDEGYDAYEPPEPPDEREVRDPSGWVDGQRVFWFWHEIETDHLERIITGLQNGKAYHGQEHKLSEALKELNKRKDWSE